MATGTSVPPTAQLHLGMVPYSKHDAVQTCQYTDELKAVCQFITDSDTSFKIPSDTNKICLKMTHDLHGLLDHPDSSVLEFASWLISKLKGILDNSAGLSKGVQKINREKMWTQFHQLRINSTFKQREPAWTVDQACSTWLLPSCSRGCTARGLFRDSPAPSSIPFSGCHRVEKHRRRACQALNGIDPILSLLSKVGSKQGSIDRALLLRHWNKLFVYVLEDALPSLH